MSVGRGDGGPVLPPKVGSGHVIPERHSGDVGFGWAGPCLVPVEQSSQLPATAPVIEENVAVVQIVMTQRRRLRAGEQFRVTIQQAVEGVSRSAIHHAELGPTTQRLEQAQTRRPTLPVQLAEGAEADRLQCQHRVGKLPVSRCDLKRLELWPDPLPGDSLDMLKQEIPPSGVPRVVRRKHRKHRGHRHTGGSRESGDRLGSLEVNQPVVGAADLQHQAPRVGQLHSNHGSLATHLQQI